uniref:Tail protein n=1 Tax=Dulem virus 36 TaxID=3145754 RepID=A0AAU8B236_9CAUD
MPVTKSKLESIPTIDVSLVVIRVGTTTDGTEYALDTANKVGVEPQTEETDAIKLIKLGKLLAQKPSQTTITGHQITLTDNVFSPTLAKILQGGVITGEGDTLQYTPPLSGSDDKGSIFELDCYSAVYDASGQIVKYEKITYPNCQGTPFAINTEDDVFRIPEYVINSAPRTGEAPYKITYVTELPDFSAAASLSDETGLSTY